MSAYGICTEHVCRVCGKHFWCGIEWAYKKRPSRRYARKHGIEQSNAVYLCSYPCMNAFIKENESGTSRSKVSKGDLHRMKDIESGKTYTLREVADRELSDISGVYKFYEERRLYHGKYIRTEGE